MSGAPAVAPWRVRDGRVELRLRLKPGAARDGIDRVVNRPDGPVLEARVRAVPEDGAANAAVVRLVADWLAVAPSTVTLVTGAKSRLKVLAIDGDPIAIEQRMLEQTAPLER